jgi:hypothetical protein
MAINKTFNRPKASTTLTETVDLSAALAQTAEGWVVDIYSVVEKDDTTTATKTLCRVVIPVSVSGSTLRIADKIYTFPGNAANYAVGGLIPALSVATEGQTVNLDDFYTQAGNARKNAAS